MWREYTREIPARPGLALIAALAALGGSLSLAHVLTGQRGSGHESIRRVRAAEWPVTVEIPRRFKQIPTVQFFMENEFNRMSDQLGFRDNEAGESLLVQYEVRRPGTTAEDLINEVTEHVPATHPIDMGVARGFYFARMDPILGPVYIATGCTPEGLAVLVQMFSPEPDFRATRDFREVCSSLQWQPWVMRR